MDELSHVFEDDLNINESKRNKSLKKVDQKVDQKRKPGRPPKLKLEIERKRKLIESSDDGICLSSDSYNSLNDSLNDSIAQRIKKRNKTNESSKQFDSGFFFKRVVDQIAHKNKNNKNEDAIIDIENLDFTDKSGVMEKRSRTEFGYFAENTLEELRKTSFRDKSVIKSPKAKTTPNVIHSTPKQKSMTNNSNKSKTSVKIANNTKKVVSNNTSKKSLEAKCKSLPLSIRSRNEMQINNGNDNSEEQEENDNDLSDESEEAEEINPLARYESRERWVDKAYQIQCLRSAIHMLSNDESDSFKIAFQKRALETLNLPFLPSGPNLFPRIIFNTRGEPYFEFYFKTSESPFDVTEDFCHINKEIVELTKIVYDLIRLNPKNGKRINTKQRQQIKYK